MEINFNSNRNKIPGCKCFFCVPDNSQPQSFKSEW